MTLSNARVSVIVPVYQGERCVLGAVRSALAQTHSNLEIIVIDDGSSDSTWSVLESIENARVSIFRQSNAGAAAARNFGLAKATGDYIAFLDSDDRWLPDKLTTDLDTLAAANAAVGIAYSWYYAVDDNGDLLHRSASAAYSGSVFNDLIKGHAFIIPSVALFHREIFHRLGGFDTARRYHEDFAFILRAVRAFEAFPTRRYSVLYKHSMSGKGRAVLHDYTTAVNAALSIADDLGDILTIEERQRFRANQQRALYFRFLMYGFNDSARRLAQDIPGPFLSGGIKGIIGWLFAKTNVNLMLPCRKIAHYANRLVYGRRWRAYLQKLGMTISDEPVPMRVSPTLVR